MKIKLRLGFFACILLLSVALTARSYFFAMILAIAIHELGHILMARLLGLYVYELRIGIFGALITPNERLYSYKKEFLLCLGGPLANVLTFAFLGESLGSGTFSGMLAMFSLSLGLLNLLPIQSFDGANMLGCILLSFLSPAASQKIIRALSFICIFVLWSLSLYLLLKISASLSTFIFSISLFCKIFIPEVT